MKMTLYSPLGFRQKPETVMEQHLLSVFNDLEFHDDAFRVFNKSTPDDLQVPYEKDIENLLSKYEIPMYALMNMVRMNPDRVEYNKVTVHADKTRNRVIIDLATNANESEVVDAYKAGLRLFRVEPKRINKRKQPVYPELLYAIFKHLKAGVSETTVYRLYSDGKLDSKAPSDWIQSQLMSYFDTYYPDGKPRS